MTYLKKMIFRKKSILITILATAVFLCSCGQEYGNFTSKKKKSSINDDLAVFEKQENTTSITHSFSTDDNSETLEYNKNSLQNFQTSYLTQSVSYGYDELFNYHEALSRIKSGLTVDNHTHSALDQNGNLTEEHLFEIVKENNKEYLAEKSSLLKDVEDDLLHRICEIVVETVNDILEQNPEIDRERVYCNLGNLKVVDKSSALDFAAVEPGMVLHINSNTTKMAEIMTSSNMYSVLVHESMHIIQFGCECEQIEGCDRRCGLAYAYTDEQQDYSDWMWLSEGSAERMTCLYSNIEPMTYKNLVNYILSLDLAIILKNDVPANYVETISFYNDLDRLFKPFDAKSEEEKKEIYQMIYALEIMQMEPSDVKEAYQQIYGVEWNDKIRDDINNKLKRPIVQTLTKRFYYNLADAIMNNSLTKNDVLFLLNLFESTINYHLLLNNSNHDHYNQEFAEWYSTVQSVFFDTLENVSLEDYENYQAYDQNTKTICAGMQWLNEAKQTFLIEKFEDNLCDYKFIHSK